MTRLTRIDEEEKELTYEAENGLGIVGIEENEDENEGRSRIFW